MIYLNTKLTVSQSVNKFYAICSRLVEKRLKKLSLLTLLVATILPGNQWLLAEGTKQLAPNSDDIVMIMANRSDFGRFAAYDGPEDSRLYITVKDPSEIVYLGLSREYVHDGTPQNIGTYTFRIRSASTGQIVHGPYTVNADRENVSSWQDAVNGPAAINGVGYDTSDEMYVFNPGQAGDYYIEISNATYIGYWDISVALNNEIIDGRVWSKNWSFRTPPTGNGSEEECIWDRKFNGQLYSYTSDGFVSKIDFADSGFQGLSFNLAFNETGPGSSGDLAADRQSVEGQNLTNNIAEHKIFLNEPDPLCFPDGVCGEVAAAGTLECTENGFCIPVTATQPGLIEIILDFNRNGRFDPNSEDVTIVRRFEAGNLSQCIPWNGRKGSGGITGAGDVLSIVFQYSQGVQHWSVYDGEFLKNGFCVEAIRPTCGGNIATNTLFWDDRNIPDNPGTNQPKDGRGGCECGLDGCRTWNTFATNQTCQRRIDDEITTGYGDKNTLNTWWFARSIAVAETNIPILSCSITGADAVCEAIPEELTVEVASTSNIISIEWSGPNGVISSGGSDNASITITQAGTYTVTATDANGCTTTCFHQVAEIGCPVDVELDKEVDNVNPAGGDVITFTIVVTNYGPGSATGIQVTDELPSGFSNPTNISNGGSIQGTNIVWNNINLEANESLNLTFQVTVEVTGDHTNLAEITQMTEEDIDSTPGNGVDTDGDGNVENDPDDEDDGDGVVVRPQPCDISVNVSGTVCDDNGTPIDPSDDTYTIALTVNGISTGSGWQANDPNNTTGSYGEVVVLGPYPISQGGFDLVIQDNLSGNCTATVSVEAPETCSNQCQIMADVNNIICDDNGTPVDPNDDTFTFEVTVTGFNTGATWRANNGTAGNYNEVVTFGPYPVSEGNVILAIQDSGNSSCIVPVEVTAPGTCSNKCQLSTRVSNVTCDDNGTPVDPSDDTFTFDITVTGSNTSNSWTSDAGVSGNYGGTRRFGPYPISGGAQTVIIRDFRDVECISEVVVDPPSTCSDQCEITAEVSDIECNANGTNVDPSDDTFTFKIRVAGQNESENGWRAGNGVTGSYDELVEFGPFPISGGNQSFIIRDLDDPNCIAVIEVEPPEPCSDQCDIITEVTNVLCNDNGTPVDPSDDTYTFEVTVNGFNSSSSWTTNIGVAGGYGETVSFGPFPISSGDLNFEIRDSEDGSCIEVVNVQAPATCSDQCEIIAEYSNVQCNDNGTPVDPSDDTYTFDLVVTGANTSGSWNTPNGLTGIYGEVMTFGPFPISSGNRNFVVRDNDDSQCISEVNVEAPEPCSDQCLIEAVVGNVLCNDNGTPVHPEDDTYTFEVTVTGFNNGSTWTAGDGTVGNYNEAVVFGPYPISSGGRSLNIIDNEKQGCFTSFEVDAPATCSEQCEITAVVSNVECDDNNTPFDPSDDNFFFDVLVTGFNTGANWVAADGSTGNYNTVERLGPYPISSGDLNLSIQDAADGECITEHVVPAPEPCSDDCLLEVQMGEVTCDDKGTLDDPYDDIFSFEMTVTGLNVGETWTSDHGIGGNYGETILVENLVSDGPLSMTISDIGGNCTYLVSAEPPTIDIICPDDTDEITWQKTVQTISGEVDENDESFTDMDLFCWLGELGLPEGVRYFDVKRFQTSAEVDTQEAFTFVLYTNMFVNAANSVIDGPMIDGSGAIFYENLFMHDPCCNILFAGQEPRSANEPFDENPTIVMPDEVVNGYSPVYQFSARLRPNQAYTLLTTTFVPENTGDYIWVVLNHNGHLVTNPDGADYPALDVDVNYDIFKEDIDEILNNPVSLEWFGEAMPTDYCGFDRIDFADTVDDEFCEDAMINRVFTLYTVGGATSSCTQKITARRPRIDDIFFPPLRVVFDCDDVWEVDNAGNPSPRETGFPFIITPFGDRDLLGEYYNLVIGYKDTRVNLGGDAYEIHREWTVIDLCDPDNFVIYNQVIKIGNFGPPQIACPAGNHICPVIDGIMVFPVDSFACAATFVAPFPEDLSDCQGPYDLITEVVTGFEGEGTVLYTFLEGEDRTVTDLPIGEYRFRYTATGDNGVSVVLECPFRVADIFEPTAICRGNFTLLLDEQGSAQLSVNDIDRGSSDLCSDVVVQIRRKNMIDPNTCEPLEEVQYTEWGETVDFTCCDVNGQITVEMLVTDASGNENTCWLYVFVEDNILPVASGLDDLETDCSILPPAFDAFDLEELQEVFGLPQVMDNCFGEALELEPIVDLTECSFGTIQRRFQIVDNAGNRAPELYVQNITINDNGACLGCMAVGTIQGRIVTEDDQAIEQVSVDLHGYTQAKIVTETDGEFIFEDVIHPSEYEVSPELNRDFRNGITTLDVIMIRRHILGDAYLTSPYQYIAADVNKSKFITSLDVIELRKLILGDIERFADNTSWRFVQNEYEFQEVENALLENFPESINFRMDHSTQDMDFIGVKIGDVNNTAIPNREMTPDIRNAVGTLNFKVDDRELRAGKEYKVAFTLEDLEAIIGYQYSLEYDISALQLLDINYGIAEAENFGWAFADDGFITTSWDKRSQEGELEEASMFTLKFRALTDAKLSDLLQITSRYTKAEAYNGIQQRMDVAIDFGNVIAATTEPVFELYPNKPNPFRETTTIGFLLPEAGPAQLIVHDLSGRVIKKIEGDYEKGYGEITVYAKDLQISGVLYYTLRAGNHSATKKMISTR